MQFSWNGIKFYFSRKLYDMQNYIKQNYRFLIVMPFKIFHSNSTGSECTHPTDSIDSGFPQPWVSIWTYVSPILNHCSLFPPNINFWSFYLLPGENFYPILKKCKIWEKVGKCAEYFLVVMSEQHISLRKIWQGVMIRQEFKFIG